VVPGGGIVRGWRGLAWVFVSRGRPVKVGGAKPQLLWPSFLGVSPRPWLGSLEPCVAREQQPGVLEGRHAVVWCVLSWRLVSEPSPTTAPSV